MNCREFREALEVPARAGLPERGEREQAEMRDHAARCPSCRAEASAARTLRTALRAWEDASPPPRLAERALARCVVEPRRTGPPLRAEQPMWLRPALGLAALGLAASLWAVWRPIRTAPPAPSVPAAQQSGSDAVYALGALRRAAVKVARAEDRSRESLVRAIWLSERGRTQP